MFGGAAAAALLPVAEQRPVQLQVTPWPQADAAFELETSWQHSETLYDTWMKSSHHTNAENPGILGKCLNLGTVAALF